MEEYLLRDEIYDIESDCANAGVSLELLQVARSYLYIYMRNVSTDIAPKNKYRKFRLILKLPRALFDFIRFILSKKTILAVGSAKHRSFAVGNTKINKNLDSIGYYLRKKLKEDPLLVEFGPLASNPPLNILWFDLVVDVLKRCIRLEIADIEKIDRLVSVLGSEARSKGIIRDQSFERNLRHWAIGYYKKFYLYRWLFQRKEFSKLYCSVYYDPNMLAMLKAAKESGIYTIEYQHGIQNQMHPMYNSLSLYTDEKSALPDCFWVWDTVAEKRLCAATCDQRKIEVVGQLWQAFYETEIAKSVRAFPAREDLQQNKVVLIALQGFPRFFNFEVLESLRALSDDWLIIIREHPLHPLSLEQRNEYFSQQDYEAPIKFSPSQESLESIFAVADVCISGFSTVCYEAKVSGVKAVFTHPLARQGLGAYIDGKSLYYVSDRNQLNEILAAI